MSGMICRDLNVICDGLLKYVGIVNCVKRIVRPIVEERMYDSVVSPKLPRMVTVHPRERIYKIILLCVRYDSGVCWRTDRVHGRQIKAELREEISRDILGRN